MILVTGAFGFIGSHLVERLLDLGEEVVALSHPRPPESNYRYLARHPRSSRLRVVLADARDLGALEALMREQGFEVVYHLAAIASHRLSLEEPHPYLDVNYRGTLSVLEAARRAEPSPKVVFASSSSVYGDNPPPLREDMEPRPKGPYALSKLFGEMLCRMYHELYGLECPIVRYFNVVGERCRGNIVFRVFAERIVRGEAVEVFNLGFGRPVSVMRVAELLMESLGRRVEVVYKELKPHESLISYSDNSKARRILGWSPKVDLEEAVERYSRWFLQERAV